MAGRRPEKQIQLWSLLRNSRDWETGKSIGEISEEIYGEDTFHSRCKTRSLIHLLRKRLSAELKERYGINITHPLFSSKPVATSERRYFIHFSRDDIDRIDHFFKKFSEGVNETWEGVKTYKKMIPKVSRVKLDVKAKTKTKKEVS